MDLKVPHPAVVPMCCARGGRPIGSVRPSSTVEPMAVSAVQGHAMAVNRPVATPCRAQPAATTRWRRNTRRSKIYPDCLAPAAVSPRGDRPSPRRSDDPEGARDKASNWVGSAIVQTLVAGSALSER